MSPVILVRVLAESDAYFWKFNTFGKVHNKVDEESRVEISAC